MATKKNATMPQDDLWQPEGFDVNVNTSMRDGIELPFFCPSSDWWNGNEAYSKLSAKKEIPLASYTGGWSMYATSGQELAREYDHINSLYEYGPRIADGKEVDAFLAQYVTGVVIRMRERWLPPKKPGGKPFSHTQIVLFTAELDDNDALVPYGPIMLTVKGTNGKHLKEAKDQWGRVTAKARAEMAREAGRPSSFAVSLFWMSLGTFGAKRATVPAGEKEIVPITLGMPKNEITPEWLRRLYIGRETAQLVNELGEQTQTWATDKIWLGGKDEKAEEIIPQFEESMFEDESPFERR